MSSRERMPSEVSARVGWFDRFAGVAARMVSRASFFAACVLMVLVWAPSLPLFGNVDTWQLVINTATTIVTFLLVALLQNTATRSDQATQHKLNALAEGLAELLAATGDGTSDAEALAGRTRQASRELRSAVGLEDRESTT